MRFAPIILTTLLFAQICFAQSQIGQIAEDALPAIVVIEGTAGTGSGVVIDDSGVVVTNYHVIEGSTTLTVRLNEGDEYSDVSIIDYDRDRDIAILKIKGFDLPIVPLGNSNSVRVGDDVVVMGAPEGFEQSVSRGIVSAIRDSGDGYTLFQTDAAISSGSSGGGMFNMDGNLIGITVAYVENAQNINFVIPINYFRGMFSIEPKYSLSEFLDIEGTRGSIQGNSVLASSFRSLDQFINSFNTELDIEFEKMEDTETWYVFEGSIVIGVSEYDGIVLTRIFDTSENRLNLNQNQLEEVLRQSFQSNYAKVGIDGDDGLIVLNETPLNTLTFEHFTNVLVSLADLSDAVNNAILENQTTRTYNEEYKPELTMDNRVSKYPERLFLNGAFSLRFDPSKWQTSQGGTGEGDESFLYTGNAINVSVIAEDVVLSYEYMEQLILNNAQDTYPQSELVTSGFRDVNGVRLLWAYIDVTESGLPWRYYYHVYTGTGGTVQIIAWTPTPNLESSISVIEEVFSSFKIK